MNYNRNMDIDLLEQKSEFQPTSSRLHNNYQLNCIKKKLDLALSKQPEKLSLTHFTN